MSGPGRPGPRDAGSEPQSGLRSDPPPRPACRLRAGTCPASLSGRPRAAALRVCARPVRSAAPSPGRQWGDGRGCGERGPPTCGTGWWHPGTELALPSGRRCQEGRSRPLEAPVPAVGPCPRATRSLPAPRLPAAAAAEGEGGAGVEVGGQGVPTPAGRPRACAGCARADGACAGQEADPPPWLCLRLPAPRAWGAQGRPPLPSTFRAEKEGGQGEGQRPHLFSGLEGGAWAWGWAGAGARRLLV